MLKHIITSMLLCLSIMARGQSNYEIIYWTDGNADNRTSLASSGDEELLQVDVSGLKNGFHTLHMVAKDKDGAVSPTVTRIFYSAKTDESPGGWYQIDDKGEMYDISKVAGMHTVDVSSLDDGMHSIRYMVKGVDGEVASSAVGHFIKLPVPGKGMSYSYMFDKDSTTVSNGTYTTDVMWLDASKLADGLHTIDIVVFGSSTTQPESHRFIKIPQTDGVDFLNCVCHIDGVMYKQEKVELKQGIVEWDIDMTDVKRGLHTLEIQVVSPSGATSLLQNSLFLRTLTDTELSSLDCYCIVDSVQTSIVEGVYEDRGYSFELDVADLEDGEHTLTYLLLDNTGIVTDVRTATFLKESETNSIDKLEMDEKPSVIYDISGRRVDRIVTSGIYIINGVKVMIRKK